MSKTILGKVDGFTPVIDSVVLDVGLTAANVFGKMWRYCQMADGVCKASQERLAQELGLSRNTVNTHVQVLVQKNYLRDLTPELIGAPHVYADTGKANLTFTITAAAPAQNFDTHLPKNCATSQQPAQNFDTHLPKNCAERDSLRDSDRYMSDAVFQKIDELKFTFNPNTQTIVAIWRETFPDDIILRALEMSHGKNINYADKILIGWQANGVPPTREEQIKQAKGKPNGQSKVNSASGSGVAVPKITPKLLEQARLARALREADDAL